MQFSKVIGQDALKRKLIASAAEGRIAHAQLLLGPSGYGGLPLALAYAQYVNCMQKGEEDSCGTCDSCMRMQKLVHPDLHFSFPSIAKGNQKAQSENWYPEWRKALAEEPYLDYQDWLGIIGAENKQGNITAEEVRDIIRRMTLAPMMDGYKVMIIWLPEYLGKEGNILLKTLEEPPPRTLMLLVSENEELVLSTILSRAQPIRLHRLQDAEVQQALMQRAGISAAEAAPIVRLADGDFNSALKYYSGAETGYSNQFMDWMRACYSFNLPALIQWTDTMAGTGRENMKAFLSYSLHLLRECFIVGRGLHQISRLLPEEATFAGKFSAFIGPHNIEDFSALLSRAAYQVERNGNPKLIFFNMSLKINGLLRRSQAERA